MATTICCDAFVVSVDRTRVPGFCLPNAFKTHRSCVRTRYCSFVAQLIENCPALDKFNVLFKGLTADGHGRVPARSGTAPSAPIGLGLETLRKLLGELRVDRPVDGTGLEARVGAVPRWPQRQTGTGGAMVRKGEG